jgi:Arc/MetJ family transcription regulator
MRTTLTIDDDLYNKAAHLMGINEKSAVIREGLHALIERESAKRLALLGGSEPQVGAIARRQSESDGL